MSFHGQGEWKLLFCFSTKMSFLFVNNICGSRFVFIFNPTFPFRVCKDENCKNFCCWKEQCSENYFCYFFIDNFDWWTLERCSNKFLHLLLTFLQFRSKWNGFAIKYVVNVASWWWNCYLKHFIIRHCASMMHCFVVAFLLWKTIFKLSKTVIFSNLNRKSKFCVVRVEIALLIFIVIVNVVVAGNGAVDQALIKRSR